MNQILSGDIYQKSIDEANDIILLLSAEGQILDANKSAVSAYGYTKDEFIQMNIYDLRNTERHDYVQEQFSVAKKQCISFRTFHYRKDKTTFPVEVKSIGVGDGAEMIVFSIIRDISEMIREEEEIRYLSFLVEHTNDAIISVDLEGIVTSWNKGAEELYGYSKEEAFGKHILLVFPEEKAEEFNILIQKVIDGGVVSRYETIRQRKDGIRINVSVSWSQIYDLDKNLTGISMISIDITDMVRLYDDLKKKEEKYRQIYSAMNQGLALHEIICDPAGIPVDYRFLEVNDSFETITGLKREEIIGRTVKQVLPRIDDFWIKEYGKVVQSGQSVHLEDFVSDLNKYYEVFAYKTEEACFACLITDITDRKLKEKELNEQYEELSMIYEELTATEEELRANYETLEKSQKQIDKANEAKNQFLANMSHEIRTPMNGIMGLTDLLCLTQLDQEQKEYLEMIKDSSRVLLGIVNDLLDISKIESGKFELNRISFNIKNNLDRIIKEFSFICNSKGLEFFYYVDPLITNELIGDELRLNQILINIMNNAVKYTESGRIILKVNKVEQKNEKIKIKFTVSDTGIGVREEFKKDIFNKFVQQDSSYTKKYNGTGLGLSIAKELVKQMNGEIWLESEVDQGSTFYFSLEFSVSPVRSTFSETEQYSIKTGILPNKEILLVEDNLINMKILSEMLKKLGYAYKCAYDGKAALEILKDYKPDLVLMDIQMPELNGFEATKIIRENEKDSGTHLPIVAMTAYAMLGDRELCITSGMDDYISKPFELKKLKDTILNNLK